MTEARVPGLHLQVETTNVCNADCCFCPYAVHKRPRGTMDLALFRRIVDQAAALPLIQRVTLTGLGETLLDRYLIERVTYARKTLPKGVPVDLYTNGSYLRPALTDRLIAAGLDVLYVSLNATNRESRKEIMRIDDYDQVVEYANYAIAAGGDRMKVIVKAVASKDLMEVGEHEQFLEQWGGDWQKGGSAYLHLEGNWAGATGQKMRVQPKQACTRALGQIMVLWTGEVSLCCFDSEGAVILGDLRTHTIREVFNGDKALGIRQAHAEGRRRDLPLCGTCTAI